jgi:hypothetical protein
VRACGARCRLSVDCGFAALVLRLAAFSRSYRNLPIERRRPDEGAFACRAVVAQTLGKDAFFNQVTLAKNVFVLSFDAPSSGFATFSPARSAGVY